MVALSQKVEEEREMYVVSKGMQPSSSNINPTPWLFVVSSFIEVNFQKPCLEVKNGTIYR